MIVSACAPALPTDDPVVSRRATPTPTLTASPTPTLADDPVILESTQSTPEPVPVQARLAVITSRARVIRGQSGQEIYQAQSADIHAKDQIEVVSFDGQSEQSHSLLQFTDLVNIELFGNTKLFLAEARQAVDSPAEVILDFTDGDMFVHLSEEESIDLTLRTPHATIRVLTAGADFDVCHTEELTCVMVKRGVVEIAARNKREVVKAGNAGVVLKDESPSPVVCAPVPTFLTWEQRYRLSADARTLRQEIDALPERACPLGTNGFPFNARILYRDEFGRTSQGWPQGQSGPFTAGLARYEGGRYYQVQAQAPQERYLAFVPKALDYADVNIDIKTRTETRRTGDFRYGVVLRRSGDRYYAFAVSPVTKIWYFLKNSSDGLQVLKEGTAERLRGLEGQDTLRVEAHGSIFLVFINNRFVESISDPEYASGDVGLFVEMLDNPDALINFNSIVVWDLTTPDFNPPGGEKCFNGIDDDADGLIDQADPDCQRSDLVITFPTVPPLPTITPRATSTPRPTATPTRKPTLTVQPSGSPRPSITPTRPTRTRTPTEPPPTHTPQPTNTPVPTNTPQPTETPELPTAVPPTAVPPTAVPPTAVPPTSVPPTPEPTDPPQPTDEPTEPPATDPPPPTEPPSTDEPPATGAPTALSAPAKRPLRNYR